MTVLPGGWLLSEHKICFILLKFGGANVQQLELKFFWPLREQIPLDLEELPQAKSLTALAVPSGSYLVANGGISASWDIGTPSINIDETLFHTRAEPTLVQRWLYRLLKLRVRQI